MHVVQILGAPLETQLAAAALRALLWFGGKLCAVVKRLETAARRHHNPVTTEPAGKKRQRERERAFIVLGVQVKGFKGAVTNKYYEKQRRLRGAFNLPYSVNLSRNIHSSPRIQTQLSKVTINKINK